MTGPELSELREQIDQVSTELVRLLNRRFELSLAIGRHKREAGRPFRDPERERALIAALQAENPGPMPDETLEALLRIILDASVQLMEAEQAKEDSGD